MKISHDDQNAQGPLREFVDEYRSRRENEFDSLPFDQQIVRLKETVGYLSRRCESADSAAAIAATTQANLHSIITDSTARERDLRAELAAKHEELSKALAALDMLYSSLRVRRHGRMPDDVQAAYDNAGSTLDAWFAQRHQEQEQEQEQEKS